MGNFSKEIEILRKNPAEVLEMKNTITQMKKAFNMGTASMGITQLRKESENSKIG